MAGSVVVVGSDSFAEGLEGSACAQALAQGIRASAPALEVRAFSLQASAGEAISLLRAPRCIRAVIVAAPTLASRPRLAEPAFLLASAARQGGIPAYGVSALAEPDLFCARMLDLQVILRAADRPALIRAGRRLGMILIEDFH
jgi:hypothetical protein